MKKKDSDNVQKLVDAGLVNESEVSATDRDIINDLSDDEVGAIISAGKKVVAATKNGESVFKVAV